MTGDTPAQWQPCTLWSTSRKSHVVAPNLAASHVKAAHIPQVASSYHVAALHIS